MSITHERQRSLLNGCNSLEKKVFNQVPIQEPWTAEQISRHLHAAGQTSAEYVRVRAALGGLKDRGLIREVRRDVFQREVVKFRELRDAVGSIVKEPPRVPRLGDQFDLKAMRAEHAEDAAYQAELESLNGLPEINLDRSGPAKVKVAAVDPAPAPQAAPITAVQSVVKTKEVKEITVSDSKAVNSLDLLSGIAAELLELGTDLATRLKKVSERLDEVALAIEGDREQNAKLAEQIKTFKTFMKAMADE